MSLSVSVVLCTHNPLPGNLERTLAGLRSQTLLSDRWETLLVDNASSPPLAVRSWTCAAPANVRLLVEPQLGLSFARRRGLAEARAPFVVLVDDDNVLAPDYLAQVHRLFAEHPAVGALGGRSLPEFECQPEEWQKEFFSLLALRDLGDTPLISAGLRPNGSACNVYPSFAPIGAGMALRREASAAWLEQACASRFTDRRGQSLTSAGDNDLGLTIMGAGWQVAYFPQLSLTHLIPAARLEPSYLGRLNRGIQKSWMQVLSRHRANPWAPIAPWTLPLRTAKAWFAYRAWSGRPAYIRWQGACGHFEGRASSS